jgi:uncharacterized surface protein with fasciclin (FAS1) repeats
MRKTIIATVMLGFFATTTSSVMAAGSTIVDLAVKTKSLSTLVVAVKAAGLVDTLASKGPFTVLAPTNAAFAKLPKGTVATLLKPQNKATLTKILTCHVIAGDVMAKDVIGLVKKGKGRASVKTVGGCVLTFQVGNGKVHITDEKGRTGQVTAADIMASNGVIHVINKVILPK